ncbi:MbcA/ParS/Xre antitoxin family protein [Rhodanobacter sp. L36]|uniref:MbcA/ParS/Xre antitoxin family protein n=1 Tax=Rhodanobacter sp. L36 TaxID=1747221 RepID=UPI00131D49A7|nr:MbcA/ParS/Xre antitoxin family protein [Rhodanobacter sp. L36]
MITRPTRIVETVPRYTESADTLAGPALRAFFNMAEQWNLRMADQRKLLGDPPESTFYKWKRQQGGATGRDVVERISYLLGIWKALQILFPDPAQADAWLHKPNQSPLFGGHSALERMLSGNVADLFVVRQYLDAQRGWN